MRKLCCGILFSLVCLLIMGVAFAGGNEASVSLDSPDLSQTYQPGDNINISGKAQNITQVTILVRNATGGIEFAAKPAVINGSFNTGFQLNQNAAEGKYTIKIGAEKLEGLFESTFVVSKSESTSSTGSGGGGGNTIGNTVASTKSLNDVAGHWALNNINKLVDLGCISGYPDGSFRPDETITRAEFATVLVKAFKLENDGSSIFTDTAGHWAEEYIAAAAANEVVSGYDADTFGPDDLITREQMAVMIVKAA